MSTPGLTLNKAHHHECGYLFAYSRAQVIDTDSLGSFPAAEYYGRRKVLHLSAYRALVLADAAEQGRG